MTEPKTKSLTSRAITVQLNVKKIFIPALIAVALVATGLFFLLKTGSGNFSNQVVVVEYINRTGDPNFDSVGRQAAQEVSQGLESLGLFGVAPLTRFELGSNNSLGEKDYIQIAQSADAAIVVTGELYFKGTDLEIRSKLYDARKKKLIPSPGAVSGPPGEYEIFKELSDRLKSAVLGTHDPLAEMWQKISPYIPRYEALLEFQRGIKLYLSNEYKSAAAYFNRAVDIDRDYLLAYLNAFWAHREARNNPAAEQYAKKIEKFANLSPGEKFIVARKEELSIRMKMTRVWAFDVAQKFEDAELILRALNKSYPEVLDFFGILGYIAARKGDRTEALRISEDLNNWDQPYSSGLPIFYQALIAANLKEKERAVSLLQKALQQGLSYVRIFTSLPLVESLWDYPPFIALLKPRD